MLITGARLTAVRVPYKAEIGPVVTAGLRLEAAEHVIVELQTDAGIAGLGEAVPRPSVYGDTLEGLADSLATLIIPPIIGLDPWSVEQAWVRWQRVVANQAAKSAVDVALHDIAGRAAHVPAYRLLGGASNGDIPLCMAIAMGTRDQLVDQALRACADGYETIKIKVGMDVAADIENVQAVREAIGPDRTLYVDANGGYDRATAVRAVREFERCGVSLLEELLPAADTAGRVRLAAMTDIPLLADESTNSLADLQREMALGAVGAISLRAPRSGFSMSRRVAAIADLGGIPIVVGSHRELGIGTAANAHLAAAFSGVRLPAELGHHVFVEHPLLRHPLAIAGGRLRLPDGPGLGVELDPDAVDRYSIWTRTIGVV